MPITFMPKNIYGKINLLVVDVGGDQGGGGECMEDPCIKIRYRFRSSMLCIKIGYRVYNVFR